MGSRKQKRIRSPPDSPGNDDWGFGDDNDHLTEPSPPSSPVPEISTQAPPSIVSAHERNSRMTRAINDPALANIVPLCANLLNYGPDVLATILVTLASMRKMSVSDLVTDVRKAIDRNVAEQQTTGKNDLYAAILMASGKIPKIMTPAPAQHPPSPVHPTATGPYAAAGAYTTYGGSFASQLASMAPMQPLYGQPAAHAQMSAYQSNPLDQLRSFMTTM
jgi:hypothetical protein